MGEEILREQDHEDEEERSRRGQVDAARCSKKNCPSPHYIHIVQSTMMRGTEG